LWRTELAGMGMGGVKVNFRRFPDVEGPMFSGLDEAKS
jgi:hypothetical protein